MRLALVLTLVTACGGAPRASSDAETSFVVPPPREGESVLMTQDATERGLASRSTHREVRTRTLAVRADRVMQLEATFLASTENGEPDLIAGSTVIIRRGEEPRVVFASGAAVPLMQAAASEGVVSELLGRPPLPTLLGSRRWPLNRPVVLSPVEAALFESGEEGTSDARTTLTIAGVDRGVATIRIDRRSADGTSFRGEGDVRFDVARGRVVREAWRWSGRDGDDVEPMHDFTGTLEATYAYE